ncbi:MAG: hypothetical protein ABR568_21830, partial [Pyrinomonadaceae bacterium]
SARPRASFRLSWSYNYLTEKIRDWEGRGIFHFPFSISHLPFPGKPSDERPNPNYERLTITQDELTLITDQTK